ncbi:hypothetical protein [Arenibacter algicola]|uniref:Uncharacterized protein n=1 Tax=Arenibacter algicola TaxID=616991 RepID=A0A221V352_9FLAO|nr:hypothetical protein [Arenibacter algicola]ASO07561.1 hypothetical protein AREALGSMS7_04157 [Arenibacter algicola]
MQIIYYVFQLSESNSDYLSSPSMGEVRGGRITLAKPFNTVALTVKAG